MNTPRTWLVQSPRARDRFQGLGQHAVMVNYFRAGVDLIDASYRACASEAAQDPLAPLEPHAAAWQTCSDVLCAMQDEIDRLHTLITDALLKPIVDKAIVPHPDARPAHVHGAMCRAFGCDK